MIENSLQAIADDYAHHGLGVFPALPRSKEPAGSWKAFQWEPPNVSERQALFSLNCKLNIGVICGVPSGNLAALDCETPKAFERSLQLINRAGYSETWTVGSNRGGHIYLRLPTPIKPLGKVDEVEVRSQGQFVLLPPSQHPDGPFYWFIDRPSEIARVESLRELDWLALQPAPTIAGPHIPRSALRLLQGKTDRGYSSRSEAEQSIITILVNASFTFDQILRLFQHFPAHGKFAEIERTQSLSGAVEWLRRSYEAARHFCAVESPARSRARGILSAALTSSWPGRTGSIDKTIFCAHATLAYRSGRVIYHASSRDLAEIAGCQRRTASVSSRRLRSRGFLRLVDQFNTTYANRYQLISCSEKLSENAPLPTTPCEGVGQTSSFLLPDAFRSGGLGRTAYEIFMALSENSSVADLAKKTGRHPQTVRTALKRMLLFGLVKVSKRVWQRGCTVEEIDQHTQSLGMSGALKRQQDKHRAERLRFRVSRAILRHREMKEVL